MSYYSSYEQEHQDQIRFLKLKEQQKEREERERNKTSMEIQMVPQDESYDDWVVGKKGSSERLSIRLWDRLKYIASLEEGWYGENQGHKINPLVVGATKTVLIRLQPHIPEPSLFPGEDGSISMEWQRLTKNPLTINVYGDRYQISVYMDGNVESEEFPHNQVIDLVAWAIHNSGGSLGGGGYTQSTTKNTTL